MSFNKVLKTIFCSAAVFLGASTMVAQQTPAEAPGPFSNNKGNIFEFHPSMMVNFSANGRNSAVTFNNNSVLRRAMGVHAQIRANNGQDIAEVAIERSSAFDMTYASLTVGPGAGRQQMFRRLTAQDHRFRFAVTPRAGIFLLQTPNENPNIDNNVVNWGVVGQLDADLTVYPFRKKPRLGLNGNLGVTGLAGAGGGTTVATIQTRSSIGLSFKIG